ncbi:MAG: hypothetical protein FWD11_03590 [Micrococcales bacterium]|nr:hypothetical protein [Micrococcales bacterium]
MVGRITIAAVGAAGVVVAGLGVASATLWRPADVLRASVATDSPYVITAPGVVEMGGQPTTVTVTSSKKDAELVVAVGRDTDVVGWVGTDPHQTIAGSADWTTLRFDDQAKPAKAAPGDEFQSPSGSDMWVAEASGKGSAVLKSWAPGGDYQGRWSVIVANPSGAPVDITMAWPRNVSTPWLIPGLIAGLVALLWAAYQELRRREVLTFGSGGHDAGGPPDEETRPRTRREARQGARTGAVPAVEPVADTPKWKPPTFAEPEPVEDEPWEPAAFDAPGPRADERQPEPARLFSGIKSPASRWSRSRDGADGGDQAQHREHPVAPPELVQPPPTRSGVPAWSRVQAPVAPAPVSAPVPSPPPFSSRPPTVPVRQPALPAAPPAPSGPSRRTRAWPPAPAQDVGSHEAAPAHGAAFAAPAPAESRRLGPFGRRPAPAEPAAPQAPAQNRPGPPSAWMPGRGGRTGAIPQVPGRGGRTGAIPQVPMPTQQHPGGRPAWLGRRAPAQLTGAIPTVAAPGTAPRLSAGRQGGQMPRGDAWRQIWGISTEHEEGW